MCLLLDTVELPYCDGTPGQHGGGEMLDSLTAIVAK